MTSNNSKIQVLNQSIDNLTMDEVIDMVKKSIDGHKTISIATVNPEFMVLSARDKKFAQVLKGFTIKTPDGFGITLLPRIFWRGKFKARITGADLSWRIFTLANKHGYRVLMLGASDEAANAACRVLRGDCPSLKIKCISGGTINPFDANKKLLDDIKAFKTDILLVGLGSPKQEYFIDKYQKELGASVAVGIGGTIDFIAGSARRAPLWMRQIGLEWLWRVTLEPHRFRRILNATIIFPCYYIGYLFHGSTEKISDNDN